MCFLASLLSSGCQLAGREYYLGRWEEFRLAGERARLASDFVKAEKAHGGAVSEAESLGAEDPHLCVSLNDLAEVYSLDGKTTEASASYERALAVSERAQKHWWQTVPAGILSYERSRSLTGLGQLAEKQHKQKEATQYYEQALELQKQLWKTDPDGSRCNTLGADMSNSLLGLAHAYGQLGQYKDAESAYKQALTVATDSLTPLQIKEKIADAYVAFLETSGRKTEADKARDEYSYLLPPLTVPSIAWMGNASWQDCCRYARAETARRNYEAAQQMYLLAIKKASSFPKSDPRLGSTIADLGAVCFRVGATEQAESLYRKALDAWKEAENVPSVDLAFCLQQLADIHMKRHEPLQARPLYTQELEVLAKAFPPEDAYHSQPAFKLADLLCQKNDPRAEPLLKNIIEASKKKAEPADPIYYGALVRLAIFYFNANRLPESESIYKQVLAYMEDCQRTNSCMYTGSLETLANIYTREGKFDLAIQHCTRALEINTQVHGASSGEAESDRLVLNHIQKVAQRAKSKKTH